MIRWYYLYKIVEVSKKTTNNKPVVFNSFSKIMLALKMSSYAQDIHIYREVYMINVM